MYNVFTVSFFGHRDFSKHIKYEDRLAQIIGKLLSQNEHVLFLVGRNGEFDQFASSTVLSTRRKFPEQNSDLVWVMPYRTADYIDNREYYEKYYDIIDIGEKSRKAHFKSAILLRNREMVDRSDLVICYVDRKSGGAYRAVRYAEAQGKDIINLALDV